VRLSLLITTVVASALWFASGAVYGLLVWFSVLPVSPEIVFPETIAAYTWQSVAPWNVVLPALSVLAFAGLFASIVLLLNRPGRATFLPVWFAAIGASFLTALIVAIGQTAANWPPMRLAMAPQYIVEALPDAGYWGIVWGWIPAVVAVLLARRAVARVSGAPVSNAPISDAPASEAPDAAAPAPRRASAVPALVAALLVIVAGVGIAASAPAADDANRALYAETPVSQPDPAYTPPPPVAVAPGDFTIDPSWCTNAQLSLLAVGGDAATGHRVFTFTATNLSDAPCVLDGYPDVAFGNDESGDLGVNLFHGGSFLTEDAGATPITLEPGATARTQLGWNANATAGVFATQTIWAAPYAGAERLPFPQELDITAGSTVAATAWEPDLPVTD
jgi:hypothetical protein